MDLNSADSLASFINKNGTRFHASVFDLSDKGWVIIAENLENGTRRFHSEPIVDAPDFLRRVAEGRLQIDPEYLCLLTDWQATCIERRITDTRDGIAPVGAGLSINPPL